MFPYDGYDDSQMMSPMELPFYQQLQLSPPSPKPDQHFYYTYPYSPPFADDGGFHLSAASSTVMMEYTPLPPPLSPPPPSPPKVECGERSRKDRHSKICTAGGMRDRRMRLSLDVARRFFALQDKLGFDKASKTVQWLLDKSKAAIKELVSTTSVSSECEDGSSLSDSKHNEPPELGKKRAPKGKRAAPKAPKKGNAHTVIPDKESRARARERARERTRERNRLRWATLASSIAVEEAPNLRHLNVEERMQQEVSMASDQSSDVIPAFEHNSSSSSSYYQEQWELSGVVFANARLR